MRKRFNGYRKMRGATWVRRGEWSPTYVINQQKQSGIEWQSYMYDADNKVLCAGVTRHERMNRAVANQIVHVWEKWRAEYVARNPGTYPTAQTIDRTVAKIVCFPADAPDKQEWYVFE